MNRILADSREVDRRAKAVIEAKGIGPEDLVLLAGKFLHDVTSSCVQQAYGAWANGVKEYERDFARVVKAVAATGIPPQRGNILAMAWAMRALQDMEIVPPGVKA